MEVYYHVVRDAVSRKLIPTLFTLPSKELVDIFTKYVPLEFSYTNVTSRA